MLTLPTRWSRHRAVMKSGQRGVRDEPAQLRLRSRCLLAFERLPQTAMSHQRRELLLLLSKKSHPQSRPGHCLMRSKAARGPDLPCHLRERRRLHDLPAAGARLGGTARRPLRLCVADHGARSRLGPVCGAARLARSHGCRDHAARRGVCDGATSRRFQHRLSPPGAARDHAGHRRSAMSATLCRSRRLAPPAAACTDMPSMTVMT